MTGPVPLRDDLEFLSGYHSPQVEVPVRLNTNESPYLPPKSWIDGLAEAARDLSYNRYPDREAIELRAAIGAHHGVGAESVFCANGSNEVIQTLLLAYAGPGRCVLVADPTYALHRHIANLVGSTVIGVDRRENFDVDLDAMVAAVGRFNPAVIFCCSPNNPTGTLDDQALVENLVRRSEGLVVVDEAYGQFAPTSALALREPGALEPHEAARLVVVRTFSKTWAMAGVRLGYLIGDPSLVEDLWRVVLPYHLSSLTQAAGVLALEHSEDMAERVALIVEGREQICRGLIRLGVHFVPSSANFVLFFAGGDAKATWDALLQGGVLVRDCSSWRGLEGWLRVTVGTTEENEQFLTALEAALT